VISQKGNYLNYIMPVIRLELPKKDILMAYVMNAKWTGIAKRGYFDGLCNIPR
jgi:hypothetical protein